ncbi:hypothetical protein [Comamonas terrigena]|uniref:hypothetical protein n=1 Tax=Comamonas terrigena TaxID=32013 RepID=UPI00235550DA|nr:hypothetical protein [Comamonas terrigena]
MKTLIEKNERLAEPETDISLLPFMSGVCSTGVGARQRFEKMAKVDLSIPDEVLARLKLGQEEVLKSP